MINNIDQLIRDSGISKEVLAQVCGVTPTVFSNWLTKRTDPPDHINGVLIGLLGSWDRARRDFTRVARHK